LALYNYIAAEHHSSSFILMRLLMYQLLQKQVLSTSMFSNDLIEKERLLWSIFQS